MAFNEKDIKNLAQLACLDGESNNSFQLAKEVNKIIDFVEQLRKVDTSGVTPLFHPFDLEQRLREDEVSEKDCSEELAALAPNFEDGFYLVPKVIDSGQ